MKGESYILVIAIDRYNDSSFLQLNNAKFDAARFLKVMTDRYGFKTIQEPLFDSNATRAEIIDALNFLSSSLTTNDSIIIYFAGHGTINPKTKKGYWIPFDASNNSISNFIPNSAVIEFIECIDAKHILLISDSCFAGTFLTHTRGLDDDNNYAKLAGTKSRWLLASGREEKVSDGQPGVGSPFANGLIEFLTINTKRNLLFSELSSHVLIQTGKAANQQPVIGQIVNAGHEGGQMVFQLKENKPLNDPIDKQQIPWEASFQLFCDAKETRPEWPYISKQNPETKSLGIWCQDQRSYKRKGKLRPDREQSLLKAGFIFDPQVQKFYEGFRKFLVFMHKEKKNYVPSELRKRYREELAWVRVQQKWFAKIPCDPTNPRAYPIYRFELLKRNDIPIDTTSKAVSWEEFQNGIIKFYENHERIITLPSQKDKDPEIALLGNKVNDYMVDWKRGNLNLEKVEFLEKYIDKDYGENKVRRNFEKQIKAYDDFKTFFPKQEPKQNTKYHSLANIIAGWKTKHKKKKLLPWKVEILKQRKILVDKPQPKTLQLSFEHQNN